MYSEFYRQSHATKGELPDILITRVGISEQAVHELVDTLEETEANLELKTKLLIV